MNKKEINRINDLDQTEKELNVEGRTSPKADY